MKKTAIFYGSTTGNTETAAKMIAEKLNITAYDVAKNPAEQLAEYDNLIFGTGTTGFGDLQDDWESFISEVESANLKGKTVAIFAVGDGSSFSDSFVGSMEKIYNVVKEKECQVVGFTDPEGYEFDESPALIDNKFVGLPLDEDNQSELTEARVDKWIEAIKSLL